MREPLKEEKAANPIMVENAVGAVQMLEEVVEGLFSALCRWSVPLVPVESGSWPPVRCSNAWSSVGGG